jgi:hypothetical protein
MDPTLNSKIITDLQKSGFASQLKALQTLDSAGWYCTSGRAFFDLDEQKTRDLDISAYRGIQGRVHPNSAVQALWFLSVEVKKSEKPWIVFKQEIQPWEKIDGWNNLIFAHNLPLEATDFADTISEQSLLTKTGWRGTGIHESFKDPQHSSRWYQAFLTAAKGAEEILRINSLSPNSPTSPIHASLDRPPYFFLVQPIVVLDGILATAEIDKSNKIELTEIPFAPFRFQFSANKYSRNDYRIDLVRLDALDEYVSMVKLRLETIFGLLKSRFEKNLAAAGLTSRSS